MRLPHVQGDDSPCTKPYSMFVCTHFWLCPHILLYHNPAQPSQSRRGRRVTRCSKVCAVSVLTPAVLQGQLCFRCHFVRLCRKLNRIFFARYFTFFEQRADLTLLAYPWLCVSGRAFVDPVFSNNSPTCSGFKWGCLSWYGAIMWTYTQPHRSFNLWLSLVCTSNKADPRCPH